jgi:hypothetical protein
VVIFIYACSLVPYLTVHSSINATLGNSDYYVMFRKFYLNIDGKTNKNHIYKIRVSKFNTRFLANLAVKFQKSAL